MTNPQFMAPETERIRLFDCNAFLGRGAQHQPGAYTDMPGLRAAMAAHALDQVLVYHIAAVKGDVLAANRRLLREIDGQEGIHPLWVLLPPSTGEMGDPDDLVAEMRAAGVRAVRLFPRDHGYQVRMRTLGSLLEPLARRRVPVFLDYSIVHWADRAIDWDGLDEVCTALPEMPIILVRASLAIERDLYPLLERHRNLYIETSYYVNHQGLHALADRFGARRLLFGTGMPCYAPGGPIAGLAYSGLQAKEQSLVGAGNLEWLLGAVQ